MAKKYTPKKAKNEKVLLKDWAIPISEANDEVIFDAVNGHIDGTNDRHRTEDIDCGDGQTVKEKFDGIATDISTNTQAIEELDTRTDAKIDTKVDKEDGKSLIDKKVADSLKGNSDGLYITNDKKFQVINADNNVETELGAHSLSLRTSEDSATYTESGVAFADRNGLAARYSADGVSLTGNGIGITEGALDILDTGSYTTSHFDGTSINIKPESYVGYPEGTHFEAGYDHVEVKLGDDSSARMEPQKITLTSSPDKKTVVSATDGVKIQDPDYPDDASWGAKVNHDEISISKTVGDFRATAGEVSLSNGNGNNNITISAQSPRIDITSTDAYVPSNVSISGYGVYVRANGAGEGVDISFTDGNGTTHSLSKKANKSDVTEAIDELSKDVYATKFKTTTTVDNSGWSGSSAPAMHTIKLNDVAELYAYGCNSTLMLRNKMFTSTTVTIYESRDNAVDLMPQIRSTFDDGYEQYSLDDIYMEVDEPVIWYVDESEYITPKDYTDNITGDLTELTTTDKTNIVKAINEVNDLNTRVAELERRIAQLETK